MQRKERVRRRFADRGRGAEMLQVDVVPCQRVLHPQHHLHRTERTPPCRPATEQAVFERQVAQGHGVEVCVHPGGVRLERLPLVARRGRDDPLGGTPHAEPARRPIGPECRGAEQLGEGAPARAGLEVELEETVSRRHIAQRPPRIGLAGGEDVGHRSVVVEHARVRAQPSNAGLGPGRQAGGRGERPRAAHGIEQRAQRGDGARSSRAEPEERAERRRGEEPGSAGSGRGGRCRRWSGQAWACNLGAAGFTSQSLFGRVPWLATRRRLLTYTDSYRPTVGPPVPEETAMSRAPLPTRPLGTTGLDLTTVGFGAWAAGGGGWAFGWGPQDDDESVAAMRRALALGVNWIDTAAVYGLGHSEEVVGRVLRDLPTRSGRTSSPRAAWCGTSGTGWPRRVQTLAPGSIRREVRSLAPPPRCRAHRSVPVPLARRVGTPIEASWAEMARLVDEGKVRAAGVSNFDVALLERCEAIRHVDSLQPPFSLIRRDAAKARDPLVRASTGPASSATARCSPAS